MQELSNRVGLIISYHNFRNTKKLEEPFDEMSKYPADFYKVVSTATNLYDNVVMMKFLEANSGKHEMVGLCMGEQGIISRVLGVRAGSIFTFGAATRGRGDRSRTGDPPANCATPIASRAWTPLPRFMAWPAIRWNTRFRR